ncbi:recombination regulator RecX [Ferrimonas gelatinilytica]|uniref:Regulatory protein RecX n=1 Tax=Ferrimonas gelatinilytica TaxID=1255257 RepID=A0ABP9S5P7_9GAMM
MASKESGGQSALAAAVGLLSRRDHSRGELKRKLQLRGFSVEEITAAIERVIELRYQDDGRFALAFVRYRSQSGKGPRRLRAELKERQVDDALIKAALSQEEIDWFELCRETRLRKFGEAPPKEFKLRQKVQRYLAYRGFEMEQIRYALSDND